MTIDFIGIVGNISHGWEIGIGKKSVIIKLQYMFKTKVILLIFIIFFKAMHLLLQG